MSRKMICVVASVVALAAAAAGVALLVYKYLERKKLEDSYYGYDYCCDCDDDDCCECEDGCCEGESAEG